MSLIHLVTALLILLHLLSRFWCIISIDELKVHPPDVDIILTLGLGRICSRRKVSLLSFGLHQLLVRHEDYRLLDILNSLADGSFRICLIVIRSLIVNNVGMSMVMVKSLFVNGWVWLTASFGNTTQASSRAYAIDLSTAL